MGGCETDFKEGCFLGWSGQNETAERERRPGAVPAKPDRERRGGEENLTTSGGVERAYKTVCRHEPEQSKADQTW
jgi:hypothetical protein